MSGWAVASLVGAVLGTVIVVLLVVVSRAVMRTAVNARELIVALEEVQSRTIVLAELEEQSAAASRVATEATSVLRRLQEREKEKDGIDPNGR